MVEEVKKKEEVSFARYDKAEVERIIEKMAKEGKSSAQIGLILRDVYGVPHSSELTGKKISAMMKEKKLYPELPEDMMSLMRKAVLLRDHLALNKKDLHSKRGLELAESKIRRLAKYYKKKDAIPAEWSYNPAKAKLIVEK